MTAPRGRAPGQGKVPGSGRKKGSLDRSARMLISEQVAFDILKTYKRLGPDWLFKIAQERPDLFINQCLSKILPPAFKEGDDFVLNQQFNIGHMPDREAAMRVAFLLNSAVHGDPSVVVEHEPSQLVAERTPDAPEDYVNPNQWTPPADAPDMPEPTLDADRERWVQELPLTHEQRRDAAVIRETREASIANYHGSGAEQGLGPVRQSSASARKPTVSEIHQRMRSRRDELL